MKWWNDPDYQEMILMGAFFLGVMVVGASMLFVTTELIQVAYAGLVSER